MRSACRKTGTFLPGCPGWQLVTLDCFASGIPARYDGAEVKLEFDVQMSEMDN